MNKPMNHGYWGKSVDYREMLKQIAQIGPQLEANAAADEAAGELTPETFALLKPLRFSHLLATEELGGAQMRPTEVLQLLEAVSYHSGSAGWVSMVHCCIGAMSAAFLPDSAVERLFAPGTDNRFSGQGAPLGMLKKVEGGYALTGKWSYGSGFSHATWSHSACFVDDGTGKPAKDAYNRPRPLIGDDKPICIPREDWLKTNASYPSGHSMTGWAWGLILAEIDRLDRAAARGGAGDE